MDNHALDLMLGGLRLRFATEDSAISLNRVSAVEPPLELFIDSVRQHNNPDLKFVVRPAYTPDEWLQYIPTAQLEPTYYLDNAGWGYNRLDADKDCFIAFHHITGYFNSLILLDRRYREGTIIYNPQTKTLPLDIGSLLSDPLGMIIASGRLLLEQGIILHASAYKTAKGVLVFTGPSGAGKTTLCRLSQQFDDCEQLCDERIVIRVDPTSPTGYQAYGTPWPGQGNIYNRIDGPLLGLFLIQHDVANQLQPTNGLHAVSWLVRETFPPSWNPEGLPFLFDFHSRLVKELPCFNYGFVPTPDAISFARKALNA